VTNDSHKDRSDLCDNRIFRLRDNTQSVKTCSGLRRNCSVVLGHKFRFSMKHEVIEYERHRSRIDWSDVCDTRLSIMYNKSLFFCVFNGFRLKNNLL